ncbi:MAG: T9SS type A sorting domain-containing protein, partial [Ferruginibacter sp.]
GNFNGTADFDPGAGIFNISASSAIGAMFVFKVDAGGNFVWAKAFDGSTSINMPMDIDASGNLYIAGSFNNPVDFDPGAGSFILTPAGDYDLFFTKLNAAGNFVWAKRIGAGGRDLIEDLSLDAAGNIYSTGNFENTVDFDPDACTTNLISSGLEDGFILKLNGAGNFIWAKQFGGADQDIGSSISINTSGAIYTVGYFLSVNVDFDFGPGVFNLSTKVNPSGSNSESNFILKMSQGIPGPPIVTINQAAAQADPTGTSPINFTVVFNEPVTGFATGDVTLSGTAGATTATVTGSGTTYNVAVSGMIANGTVIATIAASVATNAVGTGNLASTSTDNTVTYTGIVNPPPTTGFKIYPNPVIKILHIDFATIPAEAIVQVYNVTGQLLNTWALPNLNNQISMAAYNAGIYFVRVKEGDTVIATEKIVKQ